MMQGEEALTALRSIVGNEPSDHQLRILLRDSTVEAAANRFFDGAEPGANSEASVNHRKRPAAHSDQAAKSASSAAQPASKMVKQPRHGSSMPSSSFMSNKPLAERMRPSQLSDLLGQGAALDAVIKQAVANDRLPSLILWGPPGCGKTSFANCVAAATRRVFRSLSAAKSGVAELRDELTRAANASRLRGVDTILFVDELHRWSKAQQDALLMDSEKGVVTLIGATTENPSFSINNAIISRCRLVVFEKVPDQALSRVLDRALRCDPSLHGAHLTEEAQKALIAAADGDARVALNVLELAASASPSADASSISRADAATTTNPATCSVGEAHVNGSVPSWEITQAAVMAAVQRRIIYYDRNGEFHYDLISALHKSMRGGDPDASVYYCCRMLAGGEEPRYLTRRLIRFASEDVGLADPGALQQAVAADQAVHAIGMPECGVCIAQCAIYLALAPKSCAVYQAYGAAMAEASSEAQHPVPLHLRNAPTKMMESIGYGQGYVYNPGDSYRRGCAEGYLPSEIGAQRKFFDPCDCEPGHTLAFCVSGEDANEKSTG